MFHKIRFCVVLWMLHAGVNAQVNVVPLPCTNGSQNTCKCNQSPVLCTINQLNGYEYDMTTFQHPSDGPQPMCPPPEGNFTTSNNPSWFAFIAWCTDLSLKVTYSNCVDGPACPGNNNFGIQAAVYSGCPATAANAVACDTDVAGCVNNSERVMNLTGLLVGSTYYFLVDGCCGSACHIRIDVIGACSQNGISNWYGPIVGPDVVCKPDATKVYNIIKLEGALIYYWYIDGTLVTSGDYLTMPALNFSNYSNGLHTICVDAANPPCIFEADFPQPLCREICVAPSSANGGNIALNPSPACPGQTVNINVTGFNNTTDFVEHVFITDNTGNIIQVLNGTSGSFSHPTCADFTVYSMNYYDVCHDFPTPTVGMNRMDFDCAGCGCDIDSMVMSFADTQAPVFVNPPQNGTFACIFQATPMGPLNYTDNCIPAGSVPGVESGVSNACDGGTITRMWEIEDICGNTATHTQTLDVSPVNIAAFTNPPVDLTINCADALPVNLSLSYTNGGTGPCLISGSVMPTVIENYTPCNGGTVTYDWTFTDGCDREITHQRVITINPLVIPAFVNPPADITVNCSAVPATAPNLNYTNGGTGSCLISGFVAFTIQGPPPTVCGGDFFFVWTFTDQCTRTITHTQKITVIPIPEGNFVNPPDDITVNCNAIPASGTNLVFSNGLTGPCLIQNNVVPTTSGFGDECGGQKIFAWTYTDLCGRTKVDTQFVEITPIPEPYFVNPPGNVTVTCENRPTTLPVLQVTNGDLDCPINETVTATVSGSATNCGGTLNYTWTYVDVCSRIISHSQTVIVTPMPQAQFVSPPGDITVNCNQVPTSAPSLQIVNTGMGSCFINQLIPAVQSGSGDACGGTITYTWMYTDICNRTTTHTQNVTINPILAPTFQNPPANITVTCDLIPASGPSLAATNGDPNCPINNNVSPVQTGSATICGGTITYTWTFTDQCNRTISHVQTVTVTPMPQAQFLSPPSDITVTCDMIPAAGAMLTVANNGPAGCNINQQIAPVQSGNATICGGTITYTWTFTDQCNRTITHTQNVVVTPMPQAQFLNPPSDITVTCDLIPAAGAMLTAANNGPAGCNINQQVAPVQSGNATVCGGTITYTWTFTDQCNRTITHTQNVVVTPMPQAQFLNPPSDITVTCDMIPAMGVMLTAANNGPAGCNINQQVAPVQSGNATVCGGTITYTWTFTDQCNRNITHTQNVVVTPMPQAQFVNPPADVTVTCDLIPATAPMLSIKNNGPAGCNIDQMVTPVQSGNGSICGGTITYTWTFTDVCNRTTTHTQTITIIPMPPAQFVSPPASITVSCDMIPAAGTVLTVQNNGPAGCNINQTVTPVQSGSATICGGTITYTWTFTDQCNRTITHTQTVTVTPMPVAQFVSPPANVTVNCDMIPAAGTVLTVTNNGPVACNINQMVTPVQSGSASICGGTITYTWTFTDVCNRTISHQQTVTVTPMLPPQFVSPPANITVTCENIPASAPNLTVVNNGPVGCNINDIVSPVLEGTVVACGGTYNYRWTYTDACQRVITHVQSITVVPTPIGTFQNPPGNALVTCDLAPLPSSFPVLTFTNNLTGSCGINTTVQPQIQGAATSCGGTITATWTYTDFCGRTSTHIQTITVSPAPQAVFSNVPPDITVTCGDLVSTPIALSYSNNVTGNCGISGSVDNTRNGTAGYCGGTLSDVWSYTDPCGRTIIASRQITLLPAPPATFNVLPANITVNCDAVFNVNTPLSYDNGFSGVCAINGTVSPVQSGSYDFCGGLLLFTWTFTDFCNRSITHTMSMTVEPTADPDFINPPADENLDCGGVNNPPPFIQVSNGLTGPCGINLDASLVSVVQSGGTYTNIWEYAHPCTNEVFTHTQTTFTIVAPNLYVDDPDIEICAGEVFDLNTIEVIDLNNTNPVITFHSSTPANSSNEILPETTPNSGDVVFIRGLNAEGCDDIVIIYFNVFDPPNAGGDGSAKVCNDGSVLNLNGLLNGGANSGGSWIQLSGASINLSNPSAVNFNNIPPGNYGLAYIVESQYNCPSDTALFSIMVTQKITLKLEVVDCVAGGKWELKLTTNAPNVSSTMGTVQKLTLDTVRIFNIPQGQGTVITASSANGVCMATLNLDAPNCACPLVPEPTGNPVYSACEASSLDIQMTVSVPAGMQAIWYSLPFGGTPLVTNVLTYSHTSGLPGLYKYYVETFNPADGCFSLTRFEIVVEIFANPTVQNYVYVQCDALNDGVESFALGTVHGNITSLANLISFHATQADALAGINALTDPYTNTSVPQLIYALSTNQAGCKNIAELTLNLNPVPAPVLTVTNETCLGSGNGSVSILNPNPAETNQYTLDNQNWITNTVFSGLAVSNYVLTAENQYLCRSQTPFTIGAGLLIQIQNFVAVCDNKGTLSDPTDDVYHITLLAGNNLNVNGSFRLDGSNGYTANYTYNVANSFDLPANGATITFTLTDLTFSCTATRVIGPLNSCSTDCVADLNIVSYTCNGNGTPSNPGDDFYELVFNATSLNGAANNMYVLFVDNVPKGSFAYGTTYPLNISATNTLSTVRIQDTEDTQCNDSQDIGPLNSCSDQCILSAVIESIECINPGSSPSPLDDYYEIIIKANIVNGGGSQNFKATLDNGTSFTGTYNVSLKLTIPADGVAHILNIVDNANSTCATNLNLSSLEPCSGPCEVSVSISQVSCNNNGTTNDSSDDTYQITILSELINGGSSSAYMLSVDGKDFTGTYGQPLVITLPADGKAHQINVVDAVSVECKGSVQTDLLLPCSLPCSINATVISYDCNNGGTTSDNSDDTYTVTILANVTNGAGSLTYTATADGKDYQGTYGQPLIIPFMADNNTHTINILDKVNSVCLVSVNTPLLAPCSGPCVIDAVISNIQCNNAGTNDTDADDLFTFDLLVTGNNTKWKIDLLGVEGFVGNVIKLGPFPIAGASNSLLVYYENSPNCKKQVNFTVPATCSNCTQTVDAGTGGELSCTQNSILLSGTGTPGGVFSWILNGQTVTTAPTLNAGEPGKYYFKGSYPDGCEAIDSVIVSIDADLPVVSVTRGLDLTCEIDEVTLSATATGTNLKYEWTTEEGVVISEELMIVVTEEGKYFFRAYNLSTGCSSAKVLVEVLKNIEEPSSIIYAKPTVVFDCVIKTITLYNDSEPDVAYTWQANGSLLSNNKTVEISSTGDYTLIAIDTFTGCWSESNLVINSLIEYPIINLTVEDTLDCINSDVFVSADGSQVGPDISYEWRDKNNKVISTSTEGIQVTQPGNYYLILKDASNGCINEDTASVEIFENEIDIDLPLTIFVKQGDTVRLNTILNIPASEIGKITWSPNDNLSCIDCLNPVVVVAEDATYTIEVEDIYGCKGIAQVRLIITRQEVVNIPNIISVDSGPNAGFTLYGNDEVTIINYLKIYDRWGNLVYINTNFEPNNPALGWDGRFNGKGVVPGVFVYVFEVQINGIGVRVFAGDVTVVK